MLDIQEKIVQINKDWTDTKTNFIMFVKYNCSNVMVTGDIVEYLMDKCSSDTRQTNNRRLAEITRDCSIFISRLEKLQTNMKDVDNYFILSNNLLHSKKIDFKQLFNDLVQQYLDWYTQYNDYKISIKRAMKKWDNYQESIISSVN